MTSTVTTDPRSTVREVAREYEADLVVDRKIRVADRVVALELREAGGHPLPGWEPGAHIDVNLAPGIVRQYSLCGNPDDPHVWRIAVLRETDDRSRGGSIHVHDSLEEGDRVRMRGPRNHFRLDSATRYIFIAGGIGITPVLPMVEAAQRAGAEWHLHYGGKTGSSMAFTDELADYGNKVTLWPEDQAGMMDLGTILGDMSPQSDGTLVYCCGPAGLIDAVEARSESWPGGAFRSEAFRPQSTTDLPNKPFEVVLARQGVTLQVPADKSILDVIEDAGIDVNSSCQAGMCGTCETRVLSGRPDHRCDVLTAEERVADEYMMICVSRCRGESLELDI